MSDKMCFTIDDLKEMIKDVHGDLPVKVVGRYVNQDDMIMTDCWVNNEGLFFELGYEFDRAGFLR